MSQKPWDGRFLEATDKAVEAFTSSIEVDKRMFAQDIQGSIAHATMLARQNMISEQDKTQIIQGLVSIKKEIEEGRFQISDALEDIHMHIEARLAQLIGDAAKKLHTARSRNDQVALDIRMYLRDESQILIALLKQLRTTLVDLAHKHIDKVLPGYTHLQRAQPVLLSHHFMAYYEMFTRDSQRFADGLKRIDVMPLGSAALAGTTHPIDREYTAKLLNFSQVSKNSIDSVSDRDFIIEFISGASICMTHLSRLSEEFILWSSAEFNFLELPDAFTTGSSIMPQKKNPDIPELVRGKAGRVFGNLMAMLTIMKSLPLAYNRDMQEDKPPLFDTTDTIKSCLLIYNALLPKIRIKAENMKAAACEGYLNATDLADYLAKKGMPFRTAHDVVGKIVAYALKNGKEIDELELVQLQSFSELIDSDIFEQLTPEKMIEQRKSFGGTSLSNVSDAISQAKTALETEEGISI